MCRTEIVWSWVPTCWKKIDTPCIIFSPNHGKYLYYASALVEAGGDALIPYKNTLLATQHKTGISIHITYTSYHTAVYTVYVSVP